MHLIAAFSTQLPDAWHINLLRREYHGGYGLAVDDVKYAAWYDEAGIHITRGTSARHVPFSQAVSWDEAAARIGALYRAGQFATNVEAAEAHANECREVAASLVYMLRDLTPEAKAAGYLPSLIPLLESSFPDAVDVTARVLASPEAAQSANLELEQFCDAYKYNPNLLQFHYHRPFEIQSRLIGLTLPREEIPQTAQELPHSPFITEDEVDAALSRGSGMEGGERRIYNYYNAHPSHTQKEKATFLKDEYGTGGRSHVLSGSDGSWEDHDSKGLRFRKNSCSDVSLSWQNVAKRIDTLIRMNRYLTPEEQALLAEERESHYDPEVENAEAHEEVLPDKDADQTFDRMEKEPLPEDGLSARYAEYQRAKEADTFAADGLLLYRMGEFYELFGEDADIAAKTLDLTAAAWNSPEYGPISMVGVPRHNLDHYLTILRDSHDITVVAGDSVKRYPSIDHEAARAIDQHEAEFGADGWRAFGGRPYDLEEEQAAPRHDTPAQSSDADQPPMEAAALEKSSREMTQEEIDAALQAWNGQIESKRAVVRYMETHSRERDTAAWLKEEFSSGLIPGAVDSDRLEKGLTLINMDGSAETVMPWQKVQRRIAQLIKAEQFYTQDEYDNLDDIDPVVVRERLAASGIVNGEVVDPEALNNAPFIQKVMDDVDRIQQAEASAISGVPSDLAEATEMKASEDPILLVEDPEQAAAILTHVPGAELVKVEPALESKLPDDSVSEISYQEPQPPIQIPPENFRITDDHLGEGGPKAKFRANMDAIYTLKQIEREGRNATPEEQETLSRYVGWGGLADAFDENKADWTKEYTELKDALTPEEYTAARASTLNAHYTSPTVIRAIYEALGNMGFTSGNILEPACGVGNFFGCLPQEMSDSKLYGVELDSLSGRIAKQLYPNANITVAGFETTDRRDFYDLAIGNVPFGQYQVNDRAYNKLGFSIHNYFFAKALDQVRPGGVVAFITSRYTMDAKDSSVRRYLAQRAELLGAIRLPNNAFRANAGTDVVSDIIFLKKRERPAVAQEDWLFTAKNVPDSAPPKVGDIITFTTGYPPEEYTAEVTELGQGYANVPYYRAKNDKRSFSYVSPDNVTHIERKSDFVYEINQYFLDHPEMVLGEAASESTQYGRQDYTVAPIQGAELPKQLHSAVQSIRGTYEAAEYGDLAEGETPAETLPADPDVRNYSFTLAGGEIYYREGSIMKKSAATGLAQERIQGMIGLRDCLRRLIDHQLDETFTDAELDQDRAELNRLYDSFTAKYGLISSKANRAAFETDSSYFLMTSLENLDEQGQLVSKADIFTKRTIKQQRTVDHVDTAAEALAVSIGQKAGVDLEYMARLLGGHEKISQIVEDLHGVIFKDPRSGPFDFAESGDHWDKGWQAADEYLSGNVRRKLRVASHAAEKDPFFRINAEALTRAQPKNLEASEIEVRIGSTWIDKDIYEQFMHETFRTPYYQRNRVKVNYSPQTAEWQIEGKSSTGYSDVTANSVFGTTRANAYRLLEDALNLRDTRIYDTIEDEDGKERRVLNAEATTLAAQKQQTIKDAFRDWIWKDPRRREKLVQQYNEEMNATRPREYDGSHLVFSGINPEIELREHQRNAIAHIIYGGNALLAHEVGAGKTFEMVAAAMESKRLGLCSKSLIVVPNHLTDQWASEFLRLYPSANILVTTRKDFEPKNRKRFCSRIATGDYDAVIIGQSQFEKIPVSAERQIQLLQEQIEDITNGIQEMKHSDGARFSIKSMEKTKRSLEARLKKLQADDKKDDVVTFEQLGVDRLFIDESDNYKNLFLYTKMRNVAGLSTADAQKSSDLFAKCRYMDVLTGNRGVIFATGTPVSNSMTELYTIQRYLQYDRLQEMAMGHFDCWASRFGETSTALELAPEGTGYRARTRFAKFFNLPELMNLFKEVADIKTADQLNLPTPEVEYHTFAAKPTETQKEFVKTLSKRASKVHSGAVDAKEDNMLKITSDGRKLGLDQRLIDPMLPDEPGTKVNLCVENILKYWREGEAEKLTQLVFCDVSTPQAASARADKLSAEDPPFTNIYEDIRRKLIKGGMPAEQIAFIHDADTEPKKRELFEKMRKGTVRVLIGSTAKMGAGTNVQDRLIASHDLDCPWRPRDLIQRKGRIERQGNQNKKVHVCRYVTEGTFDAYLWQTIENKQRFISQIMTSKSPVRSCDDLDEAALSYAEIKALCAGDPRIKERMDLDVEVSRLRLMKADHQSKQFRLEDMLLRFYPKRLSECSAGIKGLQADMQTLAAHPLPKDGFVGMEIRGDRLTDKENAGAALIDACKELGAAQTAVIGSYRGFSMEAEYDTWEKQYVVTLKGKMSHRVEIGNDPRGNLIRIENALSKMPESIRSLEEQLENYRAQQAAAQAEVGKPFPQEQELAEKSARLVELDMQLNLDGKAPSQIEQKKSLPSFLAHLKPEINESEAASPAPRQPKKEEASL